ncbi:MAG: PEP-CTERM sorting domain-containing protein [Lentisphaeraceae bacterium]|nr:PEP-CTERM sorting domain-containing protein [Lentisphaeraceae bacterium]
MADLDSNNEPLPHTSNWTGLTSLSFIKAGGNAVVFDNIKLIATASAGINAGTAPEPSSYALMFLVIIDLAGYGRKQRA